MKLICVANFKDGQVKDEQIVRWKRGEAYDGKDKDLKDKAIEKGLVVTEAEWKKIQEELAAQNASHSELVDTIKVLKAEIAQLREKLDSHVGDWDQSDLGG